MYETRDNRKNRVAECRGLLARHKSSGS